MRSNVLADCDILRRMIKSVLIFNGAMTSTIQCEFNSRLLVIDVGSDVKYFSDSMHVLLLQYVSCS